MRGKGHFRELEVEKVSGTPGDQLYFVPVMRMCSYYYQIEEPGKADTFK